MPAPKKPQDYKKKAEPVTAPEDVNGSQRQIEFKGCVYTIDPSRLDDFEFTEAIADARTSDDARVAVGVMMIRALLGTESEGKDDNGNPLPSQYDRWKTEQRNAHGGRLPNDVAGEFMEACKQGN